MPELTDKWSLQEITGEGAVLKQIVTVTIEVGSHWSIKGSKAYGGYRARYAQVLKLIPDGAVCRVAITNERRPEDVGWQKGEHLVPYKNFVNGPW